MVMVGAEHVTKAAYSGAFIIFTSIWLWNLVKSLLKLVLSFPQENVSERSATDDHSDSEKMLVMGLMQKLEVSKAFLQVAFTLCFSVYQMRKGDELQYVEQLVVVASMMGVCLIFNGILVPECTPTFARYAELLGMGQVISAVYLQLAIPLMWWLRIILALCCFLCIRPLIMAGVFAHRKMMAAAETSTIMHAGATEGLVII